MLNIVIPMAGAGSRFAKAGFKDPKPLILVNGQPMFEVVINNLRPLEPHQFIFICQDSHIEKYDLEKKIKDIDRGAIVVGVSKLTAGAAETVLLAKEIIDTSDPLMIANCDQFIKYDINQYLEDFYTSGVDGFLMTMRANDNRWSFVGVNSDGLVVEVREKEVISNEATVGIYNFRLGSDFVRSAMKMIDQNIRHKNEFYIAPVYNELIACRKRVRVHNIGALGENMFGLGTPEDLEQALKLNVFCGVPHA